MKNILNRIYKGVAFLAVFATLVFVVSCEEDDTMGSGDGVTLLSFGPSGVHHGDTIVFIGENLDDVSAIMFKPSVEVTSAEFASQSATLIEVAVPQSAEAGTIILKTPDGDIESKSLLNFEVEVDITSITAEARPGANITITGEKINWIEAVTFSADLVVDTTMFVSQSETELVVPVPMEAQSGFLIFATGGTEPLTFASDDQLTVTLPAITSLSPAAARHESNLTISGTDLDLVTEAVFSDGDAGASVVAADFVSHSATEIVVAVPATSVDGPITLKQRSPVDVVSSDLTIVLPVGTTATPSPAVPGVDNLTITGTDLDLVATLTISGAGDITNFVSQSTTEIVFAVPEGAMSGGISYTTVHGFSGILGVTLIVPSEGPDPLPIDMFDEMINFGGGNWSWGGTADFASTEAFYSGNVSAKFTEDADNGGISVGGMSGIDASGQEVLAFSIYGGPGTDGLQVAAILGDDTGDVWGNYNSVNIVEGEWTEFEIELVNYPDVNLANVTRWILKPEGTTGGEVIYVDRVGFGPKSQLAVTMFDEAINFNGGDWSWGVTTDFASTEAFYSGDISAKFTEDGTDGGISVGGMDPIDASLLSTFTFAIYGGAGTNGMTVAAILGDDTGDVWGNYNSVNVVEGEWTEFEIDLTSYPDVNLTSVQRWILKPEGTAGGEVFYVDRIGFK